MANVRRMATSLIARGASIDEALAAAELRLGRKIVVRYGVTLPSGIAGVCTPVGLTGSAVIAVDQGVTSERQAHVLAHELGHLLLGHGASSRAHFEDELEREAEMFGTLLVHRMRTGRLDQVAASLR